METNVEQDDILRLIAIEVEKLSRVVGLLRVHPMCLGQCIYCQVIAEQYAEESQ